MTIEKINLEATVKRVSDLMAAEKNLSPALKASLDNYPDTGGKR